MVLDITNDNYASEVEKSNLPVVIDVHAMWCGPCKLMMPIFDELAGELSDKYKFAKLNVDEARDVAIKLNVSSVPTFIFVKDGKVVGRETGYMNKNILKDKIVGNLG